MLPENIYNFDKKGFLIDFTWALKRNMTKKVYEEEKVWKNKQNENREFISCLTCISAIRKAISAVLIYKNASDDLQNSWVKEVKSDNSVYFRSLTSKWSSN